MGSFGADVGRHFLSIGLCLAALLSYLSFTTTSRREWNENQSSTHSASHCHTKSYETSGVSTPAAANTATIQKKFTQPLRAECRYYDERNGLFALEIPHPRYIVTGGAGFIGSHLVKALRAEGIEASQIKVVDNLSRGRLSNLQYSDGTWAINATADFCALDLRSEEDASRYIRGADYLYHLAAIFVGDAAEQETTFHDNILINSHTLRAAKRNGIGDYIYVGTFSTGPPKGSKKYPLREDPTNHPNLPSSLRWSKLVGEYQAELATEPGIFNVGLLRLQRVYGPLTDSSSDSGQLIPSLIRKALDYPKEPYDISGFGNHYHNCVYIDDIVRGLLSIREKGMNMGAIQLGSKKAITTGDLGKAIADIVGKRQHVTIPVKFEPCKLENQQQKRNDVDDDDNRAKVLLNWEIEVPLKDGLRKTVGWFAETPSNKPSGLVIVIGQARGSEYAWKSLFEHLIKPNRAHLATFFTDSSPQTMLQQRAQFNWTIPEPTDWGIYLDQASELCGHAKSSTDTPKEDWRCLCGIGSHWLGGAKACANHPDSGGVLLAFRWLVAQKILSLNLLRQYDYFVLTRADYIYLCDHIPFTALDPTLGYVPIGEEYGGYTDRHILGSGEIFFKMINMTQELVCNVDHFKDVQQQGPADDLNIETTQLRVWDDLRIPIKQFNSTSFLVRLPDDPARWSQGGQNDILSKFDNLLIKYPGEIQRALETCNVDLSSKMTALKELE